MPGPNSPRWPPAPQKNLVNVGGWKAFTFYGFISGESFIPAVANIGTSYTTSGASQFAVSGPGDFLLQSGGGRLDGITPLGKQTSGVTQAVTFYDASVATSGGPYPLSGHTIIGQIPPFGNSWSGGLQQASGVLSTYNALPAPALALGLPFLSGLCVHLQSGQPPFSISFSPEGGAPPI
jgi:hypothetical protein